MDMSAIAPEVSVRCEDCGRPYGDEYGFPDLMVPDDVWAAIWPDTDAGGLLCPSCICGRARRADLQSQAVFRSGPFTAPYGDIGNDGAADLHITLEYDGMKLRVPVRPEQLPLVLERLAQWAGMRGPDDLIRMASVNLPAIASPPGLPAGA